MAKEITPEPKAVELKTAKELYLTKGKIAANAEINERMSELSKKLHDENDYVKQMQFGSELADLQVQLQALHTYP